MSVVLARFYAGLALVLAVSGCAPNESTTTGITQKIPLEQLHTAPAQTSDSGWPSDESREGQRTLPFIVNSFGGIMSDPAVTQYVTATAQKILSVTGFGDRDWTVTILDSPVVNAFATPGGYIYLTRGLLAVVDDEAELAAVIGHEAAHITAGHSRQRDAQEREIIETAIQRAARNRGKGEQELVQTALVNAAGELAAYNRTQELEADQLGQSYLSAAGYDPTAQTSFIRSMSDQGAIDAMLAGQVYNPNRVEFFDTHPSTGQRLALAAQTVGQGGTRNQTDYLRAIDGIVWGDVPEQGYLRGQSFLHPTMGIAFTAPNEFMLVNSPAEVLGFGPDDSMMIFDGTANLGVTPVQFLRGPWFNSVRDDVLEGRLQNVNTTPINGLSAARADLPIRLEGKPVLILVAIIAFDDGIFRLEGIVDRNDAQAIAQMRRSLNSFRGLNATERAELRPYRISVRPVQAGETIASIAADMPLERLNEERLRALNSLTAGQILRAGQLLKVITE